MTGESFGRAFKRLIRESLDTVEDTSKAIADRSRLFPRGLRRGERDLTARDAESAAGVREAGHDPSTTGGSAVTPARSTDRPDELPGRTDPGQLLGQARDTGGFSWNPTTWTSPEDGYMVAIRGTDRQFPEAILQDPRAFARQFDDYLMSNRSEFENNPDLYLGGWLNDGDLTVELTQQVMNREEAIQLGRETNQIAIFDVRNGTTIDTGGTGDL